MIRQDRARFLWLMLGYDYRGGGKGRGIEMIARFAIVVVTLLTTGSAFAETLTADAARRFVSGKLFAFNCFDGSRGAGPMKQVGLPAGTRGVRGESVCASLQGIPFEPCFNLDKMDNRSFRGSVSGFGFAYCDFTRRVSVAGVSGRRQPARVELGSAATTTEAAAGAN